MVTPSLVNVANILATTRFAMRTSPCGRTRSEFSLSRRALALSGAAFAQESASFRGMIISRDGSTMVVRRDGGGGDTPVIVTDATRIRGTKGF
jgi:hypothetical protein